MTGGIDGAVKINTLQNNIFESEWFLSRSLNDLGIDVNKMNRRNCKIVYQVKENRGKGWVFLKNEMCDLFILTAE